MTAQSNIVDANVEQCVIELSPSKRERENALTAFQTSEFYFQRSLCVIKVSRGWGPNSQRRYKADIESRPLLSPNFCVGVDLFKGNDTLSYPKIKVKDLQKCFWESSLLEVSKQLKGIDKWDFKFRFTFQKESEYNLDRKKCEDKSVSTGPPCLTENDSLRRFVGDIAAIFYGENEEHDVEIKCGDKIIKTYKVILRARSRYFKNLLETSPENPIVLRTIDPAALNAILRYTCTAERPDLSLELAEKIYRSGICDAGSLREHCSQFMLENLTDENACRFLSVAKEDDNFTETIISYIIDRRIPFKDEYWKPFCLQDSDSANLVLNRLVRKLARQL